MTIEAFIRARLDEEEAAARGAIEAGGLEWRCRLDADADSIRYGVFDESDGERVACIYEGELDSRRLSRHIARHDPDSVLRDIAAKRTILAAAERVEENGGWHIHGQGVEIICALAERWNGHPDYRSEWA